MPRRRRSSTAEDVMVLLARLPWWACLLFALVSYLVLHHIANLPLPAPVVKANGIPDIAGHLVPAAVRAGALVGSFALPLLSIGAAVVSFFGRRRRRELLLHTTDGDNAAAAIDAMSWQDFELLIAEAFRLQGFTVVEKGGAGTDGGVDLELMKHGERWLVQAKHWRAKQVPVEVVREIAGVMPYRGAVGAYVVTSGRFTGPAEDFASGRGIKLVNGSKLEGLLKQARASLDDQQRAARTSAIRPQTASNASAAIGRPTSNVSGRAPGPFGSSPPACPSCTKPMVKRQARRGTNAGAEFWGCVGYPACKGTRPI